MLKCKLPVPLPFNTREFSLLFIIIDLFVILYPAVVVISDVTVIVSPLTELVIALRNRFSVSTSQFVAKALFEK